MSNDNEFINGLIVKAPHDNAPEYVKAKLSIKREELIGWLNTRDGEWINADIKVSQGGKWYAAVDKWKPNTNGGTTRSGAPGRERPARQQAESTFGDSGFDDIDDPIPFIHNRGMW